MKSIKLLLTVMALAGALGLSAVSSRAETVISKDVFVDGSYCHTKFESIREDTLASRQPILKDVDDIIDFYGPAITILWARKRFNLRRLRCSADSRRSTTIEDFFASTSEAAGNR